MSPFNTFDDILKQLEVKPFFTKKNIEKCFINRSINISNDALNVKIHRWRKNGIIHDVAKGKYVINNKSIFIPQPDQLIRKAHELFVSKYDDLNYCFWSTGWLSNYMHHIPFCSFHVLETEKEVSESTFYHLKDNGINAYYNPNTEQIEKYVLPEEDSVIVRNLISRSPGKKVDHIKLASIEKILVDIFCDQHIYYLYSDREQRWIFENILAIYNINFSTLMNYAERRKRHKDLKEYLLRHFDHIVKDLMG